MLSVWTLLAAAICAVPVSAMSQRRIIHGQQLVLDLPERTAKLEFMSGDEREHFTIWEHKSLTWTNKPTKGQVNSASQGWTFRINHVTFEDEGTYTLINTFGATISSYAVKVISNRDIIDRVAGERLTIPLKGLKQSDATLRFYSNYSSITLVENGVPVGKSNPDYVNRLKVSSEMIQVLNVNVSDLGRYELYDYKGRLVSNNTMILVDEHANTPATGLLALLLLAIPGGICFCCRKRICKCCRSTKTPTVESNSLNTVPVYNTVNNPAVPVGPGGPVSPGGPGQGYAAGYPPLPDQGQIHYPPPQEWSGQPSVSPSPGFHPAYVPQNPAYPPGVPTAQPPPFNAPPTQYNPAAVNYTPVMYSAPPGSEATGMKMNEPPPTAPLLNPQPQSAMGNVSMDVLNSGDSSVQFDINKGKSSGSNFL